MAAQTGNTPMIHSCTSRLKSTRLPALTDCIHAVRHWLDLNGLSFKSRQNGSNHHRHWLTTTIEGSATAVDIGAVTVQISPGAREQYDGISTLSIIVPCTSGLGGHITISGCQSLSQSLSLNSTWSKPQVCHWKRTHLLFVFCVVCMQ